MTRKLRGTKPSALDDLMGEEIDLSPVESQSTQQEDKQLHEDSFNSGFEALKLRNVNFNFRQKRVDTQLVRFIPDEICKQAREQEELSIEEFVLANIDKIPLNKIIHQHWVAKGKIKLKARAGTHQDKDILKYPCHDDLYDPEKEGIFIGKGICFSNIKTSYESFQEKIDKFVEEVHTAGKSLVQTEGELAEKPKVFKTGAMYTLAFGHHRLCFLVYYGGLDYKYLFPYALVNDNQDRLIFIENNTKSAESGYETLLSYHFSAKDTDGTPEGIQDTLSIKKSYYYSIKPFIDDILLLEPVKKYAINESQTTIIEQYKTVKNALQELGEQPTPERLRLAFADRLRTTFEKEVTESLPATNSTEKETKKKVYVPVRLPNNTSALSKILFDDVRNWSKLNPADFDLQTDKGIKKYLSALVDELSES